jgi:hypothetical protein
MFLDSSRLGTFVHVAIMFIVMSLPADMRAQSAIGKPRDRGIKPPTDKLQPRLHKISITITCRNVPNDDVFAVINDHDDDETPLERHGTEWTAGFGGDAATAHASVRLGAARTDCRPANPDWNERTARFKFTSCNESSQKLTINTSPPTGFSYVRRPLYGDSGSIPCDEQGSAASGKHDVHSLQFSNERLLLQLGEATPKPHADGLVLFSSDPNDPGVLTFTSRLMLFISDAALKEGASKIDGGLRIIRKSIIQSLIEKNRKNHVSPRATDIYEATFGDLKYVEVTAVK